MSLAEKQALALRDLAVIVVKAKGVVIALTFTPIMTLAFALSITTASRKRATYTGTASWN
jgi:hypothetical protein